MDNKVSLEQLTAMLLEADAQEHVFWSKDLVISYRLRSGFTVVGRAVCVDPSNFDLEVGRKIAFDDAINQLWPLEGYLLQQRLFEAGQSMSAD